MTEQEMFEKAVELGCRYRKANKEITSAAIEQKGCMVEFDREFLKEIDALGSEFKYYLVSELGKWQPEVIRREAENGST